MASLFKSPRVVTVGGANGIRKIFVGGDNPVTIQTMWKDGITDVTEGSDKLQDILKKINNLKSLGCDIIRFAVPDMESARGLCVIQSHTDVPLVADIHFDYKLALECLKGPVPVIRINPGNIGSEDRVKAVVDACKEKNAAIRIGVNTGSLPKDLEEKVIYGLVIGYMKADLQTRQYYLDKFVPLIDSWAVCDCCVSSFKFVNI